MPIGESRRKIDQKALAQLFVVTTVTKKLQYHHWCSNSPPNKVPSIINMIPISMANTEVEHGAVGKIPDHMVSVLEEHPEVAPSSICSFPKQQSPQEDQ